MNTRFYNFGAFQIDRLNHVLLRNGETIPLKPKVFDTLLLLVENRERVMDKDEMLHKLWPDTVVEESNLSQNVYLLRKVLGESYIETMPKRGYRFVAAVNEVATISSDQISPPVNFRRQMLRRPVLLIIGGLLLLFGIGSGFYAWKTNSKAPGSRAQIRSIAVLPFKSLPPDSQDENLGFQMADTLITRLSNIKQLSVRQISSVRGFTSSADPVAAGRELKVDAVLDASVQRIGDQNRVTLRLVNVRDGSVLWSDIVDKNANDPFAVQDAVATAVVHALTPQLTGEEKSSLQKRYTESPEAHRLCMLARFHLGTADPEDWEKAFNYFNAAIEKDPAYALAYSGLAYSYLSLVADARLPKDEAIPKARQAVIKALQLDDTLPEAHVASARIMAYYDWDWSGAEREFKRAIELNANSADAHREYAGFLTSLGRTDESIAEAKQARELDPLTQVTNFQVAWALIGARRYDEAVAESEPLTGTYPNANYWIGVAYLGKGMYEQAIDRFEKTLSHSKSHQLAQANLGYAYGASKQRDKARKVLAEFEELFKQRKTSPYYIAMIYAGLEEPDQTFAWLEKAFTEHSRPLVTGLKVSPMWANLRSDPRFENLLQRMHLPH